MAVWCADDEWCPVTCTLKLIGNKWHPVIIHRLLVHDELGFNALSDEIGGVTNKVLSDSLDDLEEKGLVEREIVQEKPVRVSYSLTDRGESLEDVIAALESWGEEYLRPADGDGTAEC
ncbi:MAG: winged helix-turn-helix transcriptional regulator [Haloferacaceae archaeon]